MNKGFLTLTEAGRRLGIPAASVGGLIYNGTLPATRDSSGRRRVREDAVDKLARKQAVQIGLFDGGDDTSI